MKKNICWAARLQALAVAASCALTCSAFAQAKLTVRVDQPGHAISPKLWGIFFEDINLSADGGIYPELVQNRSFEDKSTPENWNFVVPQGAKSEWAIDTGKPLNPFNRQSLRIQVNGGAELENKGFWGMNIVQGEHYHLKLALRSDDFSGKIRVVLKGSSGELASGEITGLTHDWKYRTLDLVATGTDHQAQLNLSFTGGGTVFLDMVSLLPAKTWKDHGLRTDLAEMLAELQPSFMRFPGGCWVEGDDMAHMNHWKNTVGDIDSRTPLYNIWGYWATHGLGFHEYLQLSEDLGAEPLFCVNVGMSHHETIPLDRMGAWVQDALDAIEYANGPTNSVWGAQRARNGHPAPFHLRRMEIGNENGGPPYLERWPLFFKAIKEKYPDMQLVADVWGGYPKNPAPDFVDEHYYDTPDWFMQHAAQYDTYDRKGPKIFVGEYAVTKNCGLGDLRAAVGEAAFMTGIERNSDIVQMACYAPLFVNMNHRAWNPNLINFDSYRAYGIPSYYVQQMFSQNRGDVVLPVTVDSPDTNPALLSGAVGVGTWKTQAEFKDLKVTHDGKVLFASDFSKGTDGWKLLGGGDWHITGDGLRQSSSNENVRATIGDPAWSDYTYTLKARKFGGDEGFLVLFRVNNDADKCWWNIGGWGNEKHGIEINNNIVEQVPGHIDSGRWYDIRIEVKGPHVKCYLDGKLVHDVAYPSVKSLFASASHDHQTGDVIMKVVNVSTNALTTDIDLRGAGRLTGSARAIVLAGDSPLAENTLETPQKVSSRTEALKISNAGFQHQFPGNSVTILRIGTRTN